MDADDVARREQILQFHPFTPAVHWYGSAPILHAHTKRLRALPYRAADAAHTYNAQCLPAQPDTAQLRWRPPRPLTTAHETLRFAHAPRRCEDQCPREIGGRIRQDARCVAHATTAFAGSTEIDVVDTHAVVRNHLQAAQAVHLHITDARRYDRDDAVAVRDQWAGGLIEDCDVDMRWNRRGFDEWQELVDDLYPSQRR